MSENIQKTLWWYLIGERCYNYIIIHKLKHLSKKKWVWNEIVKQFATKNTIYNIAPHKEIAVN